jgi:hypothetical protein
MTQPGNQSQKAINTSDHFEDEIELIDLIRVIWKWKYLIIGGAVICAVVAAIISSIMPKIYSIDTIIEPGILNIISAGGEAKRVYIDSPQKIKALIDVGSFENQILDYPDRLPDNSNLPKRIEFKTSIPEQSNAMKISYETSNIEQGLVILNYLNKLLSEKYRPVITYYQKDLYSQIKEKESALSKITTNKLKVDNDISTAQSKTDTAIEEKTNKIATIKGDVEAKKHQIGNSQKRIKDVQLEIVRITKNTDFLIEERNKLLAIEQKENNILSSVIYINTIQQNIALSNELKNEINELNNLIVQDQADIERLENEIRDLDTQKENLIKQTKYQIATLQSQIIDLESQRKFTMEEIKILEFKKDNVQNIQILKPPTSSTNAIKPKKKLIVLLATMVGLFMLLFLSFILEHISKNKVQKLSAG